LRPPRIVVSLQLLALRLRQLPQLAAGAGEGHGDAWVEHVAQPDEDHALLVAAQRRQRHRASAPRKGIKRGHAASCEKQCVISDSVSSV